MFGLFKKECVVRPADQQWIEQMFGWMFSTFGKEEVVSYSQISPLIFREGIGKTRSEFAAFLFEHIRIAFRIPEVKTEFIYFDSQQREITGDGSLTGYSSDEPFTDAFADYRDDVLVIHLEENVLKAPELLAAHLAYLLALHKLLHVYKLSGISGFHITFAALVWGADIFTSNTIVTYGQWSGVQKYGWRVTSRNFITQQAAGYTIALLAFLRDAPFPELQYYAPDIRGYIKQTWKYMEQEQSYYNEYKARMNNETGIVMPGYYHEATRYYEGSNRLRSVAAMRNNRHHGSTKHYHRNGNLCAEWEYRDGVLWTAVSCYSSKGGELEKGTLKDGNGTLYLYDGADHISNINHYENGKLVKRELYFPNGRLNQVAEVKDGKPHGITTFYHRNGVLWAEWEYKEGVHWNVAFNYNDRSEPQEKEHGYQRDHHFRAAVHVQRNEGARR